jgi:glutamate racemase
MTEKSLSAPVVVIDSGSGGLTVLDDLISILPAENFLYFGDHAFVPYGQRTNTWIADRVLRIIRRLIAFSPKLVVIACNTATVAGIDSYRRKYPKLPIIGAVPVIKTAIERTRTGCVAVICTKFTAKSPYLYKLMANFAGQVRVRITGSDRLVPLIEAGRLSDREIIPELKKLLNHLEKDQVDVLALGCTHFPFLKKQIAEITGPQVTLIDSGGAIARHARRILLVNSMLRAGRIGTRKYLTSADSRKVSRIASLLLKRPVRFASLKVN